MDRNKHCGWCGEEFPIKEWPRTCVKCQRTSYNNPTPVVICLQPIWDKGANRFGLAIAQRAIPPHIGEWTLIAGHIENNGENVEAAGVREFSEETSLHMGNYPKIIGSFANKLGHLLIAIEAEPISWDYFVTGKPCRENLALDVLWEPRDLAFPIHTELAAKWFKKQKNR